MTSRQRRDFLTHTHISAYDMVAMAASSYANTPLPRMGLGMAALGRPGYINLDRSNIFGRNEERSVKDMQQQANKVMDELFALGAKGDNGAVWLDCARSYGLSEQFVGRYLRSHNIPKDQVYVSSKWGYTYVANWKVELDKGEPHEIKDHSVQNFEKQIQDTAEHLGEYLNLYQIHSATFESGVLDDVRVHEALRACRRERGWKIGLSVSGPQQADVLRAAMKIRCTTTSTPSQEQQPLFDSVQCTYNVLEQRAGSALLEAYQAGMDIIIKEGLANGRALRHPPILQYAEQLQCEPDQLALACILAQPFQARVLSGAVTPEQLRSNVVALTVTERLSNDPLLLAEIMQSCIVNSEDYWQERSVLPWN